MALWHPPKNAPHKADKDTLLQSMAEREVESGNLCNVEQHRDDALGFAHEKRRLCILRALRSNGLLKIMAAWIPPDIGMRTVRAPEMSHTCADREDQDTVSKPADL